MGNIGRSVELERAVGGVSHAGAAHGHVQRVGAVVAVADQHLVRELRAGQAQRGPGDPQQGPGAPAAGPRAAAQQLDAARDALRVLVVVHLRAAQGALLCHGQRQPAGLAPRAATRQQDQYRETLYYRHAECGKL